MLELFSIACDVSAGVFFFTFDVSSDLFSCALAIVDLSPCRIQRKEAANSAALFL
jgi:hypothetical protein